MAGKRLRQPVHLVLDWDGTLTTKDTLAVLGGATRFRNERLQRRQNPSDTTWDEISRAYRSDFQNHKAAHFAYSDDNAAAAAAPATGESALRDWLNSLKPIEMRSALRVQNAGYFHGVTTEDVKDAAKEALDAQTVQLRGGWMDLFALFLVERASSEDPNAAARISILSVNWSETFIRWTLWYAAQQSGHPRKKEIGQLVSDMEIYANEIHGLGSPEGSSGRLVLKRTPPIQTSGEKAKYMPPRRQRRVSLDRAGQTLSPPPAKPPFPAVVYVGDSQADYDCLVAADTGIWLRDVPEAEAAAAFRETFRPLDVEITPLRAIRDGGDHSIVWTPSLEAVTAFLSAP